uniref:Uncharacterized protein n=1 Tax=Oryza sativa subsp. japonica TaxID=39947 RepID=Q6UU60_ORYSJ|nr:hypothetical protein OSJNBa0079E14.4 [Oryza sativa Japonica Group]
MAKSSPFDIHSSPYILRPRGLWLCEAPALFSALRGLNPYWSHGFGRFGRRASCHTANKPLTGKGEIGASAETVQTMWYDDGELAKLVSSGVLVEGQAFAPGKAVVPKPVDNQTVVFAGFFEAGLRFPCNMLLPEILHLFQVEFPQLRPSALVRIAIFD